MNSKGLLIKFLEANDEDEVQNIISSNPTLADNKNWRPYGDNETNFNQGLNQQSNPVQALVEKPINSIDAILLKECKLLGIDPKGALAPNNINEAVERFFNIPKGDFFDLTDSDRRKLAENIQIIAEGSREKPNIIIYDNGEGQHPTNFKDTFLSLSKNNKLQIKFVQGQYCMGSTGVLPNCGKKKFQLIVSRKHSDLLMPSQKDLYGFTVVRKHTISVEEEKKGFKSSWFEYFVDEDGQILSFEADKLDVGLYKREYQFGSYIKLYNYHLSRSSDITLDLWRDLNQFLYHPPLPILLSEKRNFKGHSLTKVMNGNRSRILIDDRNSVKKTFPLSFTSKMIGRIDAEVTIFNSQIKNREFIDKKSVILTRNGQVHGFFDRSYISQEVKLTYLKDQILVHVKCDHIPQNIREEIFMPSRDRYRESDATDELWKCLAKELHQNELLKELNNDRMNELIYENKADREYVNDIMKKIVQKDKSLINLLTLKGEINFKGLDGNKTKEKHDKKERKETFLGKRFPSIFKIKNGKNENEIKTIPLNGEGIIKFETDVENEYLIRPVDSGEFVLQILQFGTGGGDGPNPPEPTEVADLFEVSRVGPYEGSIKLRLKPLESLSVGSEMKLSAKLTAPDGDKECIFWVKVGNKTDKELKPIEHDTEYSLPVLIPVFRERNESVKGSKTWDDPEYNWDGNDIIKLYPSSNENSLLDAVAVNMDSFALSQYIKSNSLSGSRLEATKRVYEIGIFLSSIFHYSEVRKRKDEWKNIEPEEVVQNLMKGYSKVLLYLLLNEQLLKEIEEGIS